jgi:hypothetical protein
MNTEAPAWRATLRPTQCAPDAGDSERAYKKGLMNARTKNGPIARGDERRSENQSLGLDSLTRLILGLLSCESTPVFVQIMLRVLARMRQCAPQW